VRAQTHELDELVAGLAKVHDRQLQRSADSNEAREILDRILALPEQNAPARGRALLVSAAALTVLLAAGAGIIVGSRGTTTASAATVLKEAAAVARAQQPLLARSGQFVYTKSAWLSLDTYVDKGTSYSALIPWSRESWVGPTGGRMRQVPGQAHFLSERDRDAWIAAGRPSFTGPAAAATVTLPAARPLDLPADPDRLFERLKADAAGYGDRQYDEMFVFVGDSLRETNASPEQRAALYAVAARIPGVDLVGPVTDSAGRPGIAVAKDDNVNHIRSTLVFDPKTSVLLAEEESTLPGNSFGYPRGTRIELATYLQTVVVGSLGARP
jgi:hypothetical protein